MCSVHSPSRLVLVLLALGCLQHAAPLGASAQVSETGPPLAKSERVKQTPGAGGGAPPITSGPHAGVERPKPTRPGSAPHVQVLP